MANIMDYIAWRADVPLTTAPFNEVDALILSQLSYLDLTALAPDTFVQAVPLRFVAQRFKEASDYEARSDMGAVINQTTVALLDEAGKSARFGDMEVCGLRNTLDEGRGEQFCAVTFLYTDKHFSGDGKHLPQWVGRAKGERAFVAYRGTDDTIVGWKEDFNLAVMDTVPAQTSALSYLNDAMRELHHRRFVIGGHSKGGNLAVYAAAMLEGKARNRIDAVYNMDGPGFTEHRLSSPQFQSVLPLLRSYYPQFSIVGMIFSHAGDFTVVSSDAALIMQHDPFSWQVGRSAFIETANFDWGSSAFHTAINTWLTSISESDRATFVEALFRVIEATGMKTNSELESNFFVTAPRVIKALASIDSSTREQVMRVIQALLPAVKKGLQRKDG